MQLSWQTLSEVDIIGFRVLRGSSPPFQNLIGSSFIPLNADIVVATHAGIDAGATYRFFDVEVVLDVRYWYTLEVIRQNGGVEYFGMEEAKIDTWLVFTPFVAG